MINKLRIKVDNSKNIRNTNGPKVDWRQIIDVFIGVFLLVVFSVSLVAVYLIGLVQGYQRAYSDVQLEYTEIIREASYQEYLLPMMTPAPESTTAPKQTAIQEITWGGPELWQAVNDKRQEYGVNPLGQRDELCTIASIRLNELLALGILDGHEGFSNLQDRRPDMEWIFQKYSNMAEFLAMGGETPGETVSMWENTLGHKKLLTGGEFVWGCIYAQNSFAVAITAY